MNRNALERIILQLREENEKLKEENAYLKFRIDELQASRYKSKKKPPDNDAFGESPAPKKKGGSFGHIGWFRKKPAKIDRVEDVKLDKCPACGSSDLSECAHIEEHIQEDIILPQVESVLYKRRHYYCKGRKKVVSGLGKDELPNSYIGPKAKSFAAFLKYVIKISDRDVRTIFKKAFNFDFVTSSVTGFKCQIKKKALPLYKRLLEELKKGPFIHADETGWNVDGDKHWLSKFSNKKICISHIDKGRGQKVVENILGKKYNGTLISDFLSAYDKIETKAKQKCCTHLLHELKKVMKYWRDDEEVMTYCRRLKKILTDAMDLHREYKGRDRDRAYRDRREALKGSLDDFEFPNPNKRVLKRLAKRLIRRKGEILTFLYKDNIDPHNNHAEQQIRPDVIFRKITFGNRSPVGAENHGVLMTILQTAKLNDLDPIATLEQILTPGSKNPFNKILSPPKKASIG